MRKIESVVLGGLMMLGASPAMAVTATGSLAVQITIQTSCVVSATLLDFGTVGVLTTAKPGTATITVTCTPTTAYAVGLDAGIHETTTDNVNTRQMANGATLIAYQLYQDSGHTIVWGTATSSGDTGDGHGVGGTGSGAGQPITVYGLVPIQNTPAAATYTDTVAIVVQY